MARDPIGSPGQVQPADPGSGGDRRLWTLTLVVMGTLACSLLVHTWPTLDIWYHLRRGFDIVETGSPLPPSRFVMQHPDAVFYWLFQLLVAGLYQVTGVIGTTLFFLAVWIAAFTLLFQASGLLRAGALGVLWMVGALILGEMRFDPRPEALSFLCVAALVAVLLPIDAQTLARGRRWWPGLALLAGIQVLWCNTHGYFVLGPLLVGLKGLHLWWETPQQRGRIVRLGLLVLGVQVMASCVSPFGVRTLTATYVHLWLLRDAQNLILEFRSSWNPQLISLVWTYALFWALWGLTALGVAIETWRTRRLDFRASLALVGLYLGASSIRLMVFLVFFSAPLAGMLFERFSRWLRRTGRRRTSARRTHLLALGVALCTIVWVVGNYHYRSIGSRKSFGFGIVQISHPDRIVDYLARHPFGGLVFNMDYAGSYLEFRLPALRLYGNTQFTDTVAVREYQAAYEAEGFWRLHDRHHFDAAMVDVVSARGVVDALLESPRWRLVYGDLFLALFVNQDSDHAMELPVETPMFLVDEDLSFGPTAYAMIRWSELLGRHGRRDLLLALLQQLGAKGRGGIPGPVIGNAVHLALAEKDTALVQQAAVLRPGARFESVAEQQTVDALLQEGARMLGGSP